MLSDERLIEDMFGIKYPKDPTEKAVKEYNRMVEQAMGSIGKNDPQIFDKLLGNLTKNNDAGAIARVGISGTEFLTGVSATGAAGTVTVTGVANISVTGAAGTGAAGSATGIASVNPTGVSATGGVGAVTVNQAFGVTGVQATGSVGNVLVWGQVIPNVTTIWTPIAA